MLEISTINSEAEKLTNESKNKINVDKSSTRIKHSRNVQENINRNIYGHDVMLFLKSPETMKINSENFLKNLKLL